jgi:hypothetical protein
MTKKVLTVTVSTSTTPTPFVMEALPQKETHASDPQIKTWLTTASDDELIALWAARYGDGWRISQLESITLQWEQWEETFDVVFIKEMSRRGLVEKHYHMAEQATLYKLKCKS